MDPNSLELLLFLHFNKDLWDNSSVINRALAWDGKEKLKAGFATAAAATAATVAPAVEGNI
jgi:hypothetical protein